MYIWKISMFNKTENAKQSAEAQQITQEGITLLNNNQYDQAMLKFDKAISIYPDSDVALYHKGLVCLAQTRYAEAAYYFETVIDKFPPYEAKVKARKEANHLEKMFRKNPKYTFLAELKIKEIREVAKKITPEEIVLLDGTDEKLFRNDYCTKQYLDELNVLQTRHKEMKQWTYTEKIDWVIILIEFCFKYYNSDKKTPLFAEQTILTSTPEAKAKRLKLGNIAAKFLIQKYNPQNISETIEIWCLTMLDNISDDIFLDDSRMIFRLIFETIHQLPREKRGDLLKFLPWDAHSWYLLEFCSTFFHEHFPDSVITIPRITEESVIQLNLFQRSIQQDICLVKAVLPDLIKHDLPKLHEFFISIQANIKEPLAHSIAPLKDMTNLRTLLWYFKHTYQFARLLALLPSKLDSKNILTPFYGYEYKTTIEISPHLSLLMLENTESTLVSTIKSKLTCIRRIQLVGEIFTHKGWGTYLDDIDYIDFNLLQNIRDGLSHIEDLQSVEYVYALEDDHVTLISLYQELNKLKDAIYGVITKRQAKFTPIPDATGSFASWEVPMQAYWNSIKLHYEMPQQFNANNFIPYTPLFSEKDLSNFMGVINKESPFYDKVDKMLNGQMPLVALTFDEKKSLTTKSFKQKKIKAVLDKANTKYQQLKTVYVQEKAADKKEKRALLSATREELQTEYPTISALGRSLLKLMRSDDKMCPRSVIDCLKVRFGLLRKIFLEAGLNYDDILNLPSAELVNLCVTSDVELLMSCAYLITQIVSIMNKLESSSLLAKIHSDLPERLADYIALRNALEHNDSVIDSKDNGFIQMQSNTSIFLAQIAHELMVKFSSFVEAFDLQYSSEQFISTNNSRNKQATAIDYSILDYPSLPVMKLKSYETGFSDLFFYTAEHIEKRDTDSYEDSASIELSNNT